MKETYLFCGLISSDTVPVSGGDGSDEVHAAGPGELVDRIIFGHDNGVAVLVQAAAVYELALGAAALGVFLVWVWITKNFTTMLHSKMFDLWKRGYAKQGCNGENTDDFYHLMIVLCLITLNSVIYEDAALGVFLRRLSNVNQGHNDTHVAGGRQ